MYIFLTRFYYIRQVEIRVRRVDDLQIRHDFFPMKITQQATLLYGTIHSILAYRSIMHVLLQCRACTIQPEL